MTAGWWLGMVLVAAVSGCGQRPAAENTGPVATPAVRAASQLAPPAEPPPAGARPFFMGFTSWPYAATTEAVEATYALLATNADLVVEHLDDGVPWPDVLEDKPWPGWFQARMEGRRKHRPPGAKLLLSLTALDLGRRGLCDSLAERGHAPVPSALKDRPFDDPAVIRAYVTYCRRMVHIFKPDFLLTGIEVNELLNNTPTAWEAYGRFSREVRRALRREHPDLPIAESVTLHKLLDRQNRDLDGYRLRIQEFVSDQDFLAVSFYPLFLGLHSEAEFSTALDFLPSFSSQPIAITETGHPADPVRIKAWQLDFPATPAEQAAYARVLLEHAQRHQYRFVTWWVARDFDALWEAFPPALKDLGAIWRDTGLLDEDGRARPAWTIWNECFRRSRAPQ